MSKISDKLELETTRVLYPHKNYKDVWLRAKAKLLCSLRISKFMEEISMKREKVRSEVRDYLTLKANLYHRQSITPARKLPWGIFHPSGRFKQFWNIFIGFLLLYTATLTPFVIAFLDTGRIDTWFVIDTVIDFCYICDVIINCNTAFYDQNSSLKTTRKQILMNYLKGWMILDVIACIPLGSIPTIINVSSGKSYNKLIRLFRLRSIPKLFRLSKALKLIKTYRTSFLLEQVQIFLNINHSVMRLLATLAGSLVSLHVVACFWYLFSSFSTNDYESWVYRYGYEDSDTFTLYITSVYWAITTLTSVGYGDIVPFSDVEIIFTICWIAGTMYFLSFTVSSLSSVITMLDIKKKTLDLKLTMVDEYAKEARVPKSTKFKMQNRIRITNERIPLSLEEEEKLMREIPKDLKFEIACNIHDGFLNNFPFFKDKGKEFITSIALFLQPHYYSKNDMIISKGEIATEIYLVLRGSVSFVSGDDQCIFKVVGEGHDFGDIEVLLKIKRLYTVNANCETTLLVMREEYVKKIREGFPGIWREMKDKAHKKLGLMNAALAEVVVLKKLKASGSLEQVKPKQYKDMINNEIDALKVRSERVEATLIENRFDVNLIEEINRNHSDIVEIKSELDDLLIKLQSILPNSK